MHTCMTSIRSWNLKECAIVVCIHTNMCAVPRWTDGDAENYSIYTYIGVMHIHVFDFKKIAELRGTQNCSICMCDAYMHACMYLTSRRIGTCIVAYMYIYIYIHTYIYIYIHVCMHTICKKQHHWVGCIFLVVRHACMHAYVYLCIHACVCMHACICVCMHAGIRLVESGIIERKT